MKKKMHLLEIIRALFFNLKVLEVFWENVVAMACYLINHMPSTVLNGKIPYSMVFPTCPLFPLPHHIFSCTCFVQDVHPQITKLDSKSLKCVFVGNSHYRKGVPLLFSLSRVILGLCWHHFFLSPHPSFWVFLLQLHPLHLLMMTFLSTQLLLIPHKCDH